MYYNGINWHYLPECALPNTSFYDVWTQGTEVFVSGKHDGLGSTIILHGSMPR